jgi:glucose/arabinose dehydrogenase
LRCRKSTNPQVVSTIQGRRSSTLARFPEIGIFFYESQSLQVILFHNPSLFSLVSNLTSNDMKTNLLFIAFFLLCIGYSLAQTFPTGFSQVLVANTISNPTVMAFSPDGRIFVAQQSGALRVIKNGVLLTKPFITLNVNSSGERGLLGIAFDPNFSTNNFIYLYYTLSSAANNRISRFTASGDTAIPGSEVVVLNLDPLSTATNHNGGTMQFAPDGTLYVGVGENANSANSQDLDTYLGKILRINSNGSVPAGNPYTTGSAQRMRVWEHGMRNPYTLTFQPGTGKLFVNDVGQNTWEEINNCTAGGGNYGWPTVEGFSTTVGFKNPVFVYGHGSGSGLGCAITGGTFFNPPSTNYPAQYIGKYFYHDYCSNWIDYINPADSSRSTFGSSIAGSPVGIITGPDGNLYFLSRTNSAVYKITYNGGTAPVITNQPQSQTIAQGNPVTFTVTATGTNPLTYQWRKNTVNITGATNSSYTIASVTTGHAGNYTVVVTNSAGNTTSNIATLTVTGPNSLPNATITSPAAGATYAGGSVISYAGSGSDPEDGALPASGYQWFVEFHHDTHIHPGPSVTQGVSSGTFTIPNIGETSANVYYRVYLVVTDSQGAKDSAYTDILPRTSTITLNANYFGLYITLDGQPFQAPITVTSVEGMLRTIGSTSPQTINNAAVYNYDHWSQGGSQTQTFATPVNNVTYTVFFTPQYRNADNPVPVVNGLDYKYYQGTWNLIPDFNALVPVATGTVTNFDLTPRLQNDNFGFRFSGYIQVPTDGIYNFYTSSDDGSKLYIGGTMVVKNDTLHSAQEKSGQIWLKAGKHPIRVDYFERTGSQVLTVSYSGPNISKQAVPASALFRQTSVTLNPVADTYVRSGTGASTNFGTAATMSCRKQTTGNQDRQIYIRFDISTFSANISSAKLRLYGNLNNTNASNVSVDVRDVTNNTWGETTITYTNKPAPVAAVVATKTILNTTPQWYEWDLTSYLIAKKNAGATLISLNLQATNVVSNQSIFNTKENASNKPQLAITFSFSGRSGEVLPPIPVEAVPVASVLSRINVYPNPATTLVFVQYELQDQACVNISLYDLQGRIAMQVPCSEKPAGLYIEQFDLSAVSKGMYMLMLQTGEERITKRLMVE